MTPKVGSGSLILKTPEGAARKRRAVYAIKLVARGELKPEQALAVTVWPDDPGLRRAA